MKANRLSRKPEPTWWQSILRLILMLGGVLAVTVGVGIGASGSVGTAETRPVNSTLVKLDSVARSTTYGGGQLMAADPTGGYWSVTWLGAVTSHEGASTFGSPALSGTHLAKPIVGMAATPNGEGYWLVASDGGIFSFGNASFYGSTGAMHLNQPIVGMAATPDGGGYWLVASDGGIFTFGDAKFYGSTGGTPLNQPIVGLATTPDEQGYWLVASDGGIFSFGDAKFYGSTGAIHLNKPIVGMAPSPDGGGYWLVASDGGIFSFGDATFYGSLSGSGDTVEGIVVNPSAIGYTMVEADGAGIDVTSPTASSLVSPGSLGVSVSGNHLVNQDGQTMTLRGVDRSGTEFACVDNTGIFSGPSDAASVAAMKAWGVNAVRVPLNEDCWLGINGVNPAYSGATYQSAIAQYVQLLNAAGMYVILDLHWTAPGTTLATDQMAMPDADHAPTFWSQVAAAYKNNPSVIFDLFNEPFPSSSTTDPPTTAGRWNCWLNGGTACGLPYTAVGMQTLLNTVRATGATNVVMAGGLNYANDLSEWLQYEPTDPLHQLAASWHSYNFDSCSTASCWNSTIAPVAAQVPVITGEFGENDCGTSYVDPLMTWMNQQGISYLAWAWTTSDSCGGFPSLISDYDGTPTGYGVGVQADLQSGG
jgi:endoglucanase